MRSELLAGKTNIDIRDHPIIIFIVVLMLIFIVIISIYNFVKIKREKDFCRFYEALPYNFKLSRCSKGCGNRFVLGFPRWSVQNKDGRRNQRYKNNPLLYQESRLCLNQGFVLTCNNPLLMIKYVTYLREKQRIWIEKCDLEIEKSGNVEKQKSSVKYYNGIEKVYRTYCNDPFEFEKICAELLRKEGNEAFLTSKTNDGGFDIKIKTRTGKKGIVECKCYQPGSTVGRPVIQKLVGANATEKADFMIIMTTAGISNNAVEYAKRVGVSCIDGKSLLSLYNKHFPQYYRGTEVAYDDWKVTESYVSTLIPPDVYNSLLVEKLVLKKVK